MQETVSSDKKVMPLMDGKGFLLCLDCKKAFSSSGSKGFVLFGRIFKRIKCPRCGSKRVVNNPFVVY